MPFSFNSLDQLLSRPVAIFGAGITGRSVDRYLKGRGVETVFYDEQPQFSGDAVNDFLAAPVGLHDLAVMSPGFAPRHPWVRAAHEQQITCMGDLDLASFYWPGKVLGITGTNGKSTLTLLMESALNAAGIRAVACGNIGQPLLDQLNQDFDEQSWAVCEISSFQAEMLQHLRPDAVLWTNFDEDHLDRYPSVRDYFLAKHHLLTQRKTGAPAWVGPSVVEAADHLGAAFGDDWVTVRLARSLLQPLAETSPFKTLPQAENFCLGSAFWASLGQAHDQLVEVANQFRGLPHRIEQVAEVHGIRYWNDSKATNFSAALAALKRFDQPVYWIAGGRAKGGDLRKFLQQAAPYVGSAYFIGETADSLKSVSLEIGISCQAVIDLKAAVKAAHREARAPGNVLFSPGFASFDQFQGYAERGDAFKSIVRALNYPVSHPV